MNDKELIKSDKKPKKSFKETIALMIRKKWLSNTSQTILIVVVLFSVFLAINLYVQSLNIDTIDITKNKIYSLSKASEDVIKKVDKNVTIYLYGIEEGSMLSNFVHKYEKLNNKIKVELLTEEKNLAKVQEYDLESGYEIIVMECDGASKIIDTSYELYSYDYSTGQEIDLTEQTITNSILSISSNDKPKIYFTTGHEEYGLDTELGVLSTYLKNESYITSTINLLTENKVPEDCNLLVIMAPIKDFMEPEVESILNYINRGGDLIISSDVGNIAETYPNLQRVFDQYGVKINHTGYVYETDSKYSLSNYPNIFMPQVSSSNEITSEMYTDGNFTLWFVYAGRLEFESDDKLKELNVLREDLLTSTENSLFISDIDKSATEAVNSATKGKSIISSVLTKTILDDSKISETTEEKEADNINDENDSKLDDKESTAVFIANSSFITDYKVEQLSSSYPISYLGNNRDFMLNSIGFLSKKENSLKIRKDMSSSTYAPTAQQHRIVMTIIFLIPILIIVLGIVVWQLRRRKR